MLKHLSFADFLLIEVNEQGAVRKEAVERFVEWFKTTPLRKAN